MTLVAEGRHTTRSLVWVENNALSPRELDVLRLIAQGHDNQEIADLLCLSERTVRTHGSNILSKLGVKNRTHAVYIAYGIGYLTAPTPHQPDEPSTARQAIALAAYYSALANVMLQREDAP